MITKVIVFVHPQFPDDHDRVAYDAIVMVNLISWPTLLSILSRIDGQFNELANFTLYIEVVLVNALMH